MRHILGFFAVCLVSSPAFAGLASIPVGTADFQPSGTLSCTKLQGGGLVCFGQSQLSFSQFSTTQILVESTTTDVVLDIAGAALVAEVGAFPNGVSALRISGVRSLIATRLQRGAAESTLQLGGDEWELQTDTGEIYLTDTEVAAVMPGDNATIFAGFDRKSLSVSRMNAQTLELATILSLGAGGTAKIDGVNGDALLSGVGGTFVDPAGSSTLTISADGVLIEVLGATGDVIRLETSPTTYQRVNITVTELARLKLAIFDAALNTAVIAGQRYDVKGIGDMPN